MKCLETRRTPEGFKRRRYLRDDGTRETTIELPFTVVKAIGRAKIAEVMAIYLRGELKRMKAGALRRHVAANIDTKPTALANELGCSEARVRQLRKGLRPKL